MAVLALSGASLLSGPRSAPQPRGRGRSTITAAAAHRPSWLLEQPKRLWEAGGELWLPGVPPPSYLDGSLPGDRGFDPLRLATVQPGAAGEDLKARLPWLLEGELYNGRVAMLAVPGILAVELLGRGPWWNAWKQDYAPGIPSSRHVIPHLWDCSMGTCPPEAYSGSQAFAEHGYSAALGIDKYWAIVLVAHAVWGTIEYYRYKSFKEKGETGLFGLTPFDPLNLRSDYSRQSEIRNGRLAMLANLGFWCQAATTGKGPVENLKDHLSNPLSNNILATAGGQRVAFVLAAAVGLLGVIGRQNASKDEEAGLTSG